MKILKYRMHPGMNTFQVPEDQIARLLYLNDQDGKLMGWIELTPTPGIASTEYEIYIALTGEDVPPEYRYVTSHQINTGGGYFVAHAYD